MQFIRYLGDTQYRVTTVLGPGDDNDIPASPYDSLLAPAGYLRSRRVGVFVGASGDDIGQARGTGSRL